jgi:hypothetical protein
MNLKFTHNGYNYNLLKMCFVGCIMKCMNVYLHVYIMDYSICMSYADLPFFLQSGRGAGFLSAVSLLYYLWRLRECVPRALPTPSLCTNTGNVLAVIHACSHCSRVREWTAFPTCEVLLQSSCQEPCMPLPVLSVTRSPIAQLQSFFHTNLFVWNNGKITLLCVDRLKMRAQK